MVLPTGCPRSEGLLAGSAGQKSKSSLFPRAGGGQWLQMTSALHIQIKVDMQENADHENLK